MPRRRLNLEPPSPTAISYTLRDGERISGLSSATLRRRAKAGELILFRNGGRTLISGDSLRRMLSPVITAE
ncbi:MerR family transcriptional regulator [Elioraea rosea]|uniref:hypothetical protein n=1 Tax=Elioraea rosea TaxID=2492390 RepID=UPI00118536F6|nr:hypothetical protein [Elioraea rosea]